MNCDYTDPGGTPLERLAQQQAGTHPAPCARSCEANAYEIQIRQLSSERDAMAAKLAELEGQEPVAWIYDWQAPEGLIRDWSTNNAAEIPEGATNIRPLFARQVPAEPVNVRLLEAMKRAKSALVSFKFIPGEANRWEESDEEALAAIDSAIAAADAQQERLLQDMHDAGREIDRVMAEPAPKEPVAGPVNARLLAALKVCRHKFAQYVAHHISKGDMHKAMANESMVAMADVAIMAAEAAPRVARLTADELRLICDRWADEDGATGQTGRTFLARAIEAAALRKNGLAMED